ncbi:MAG TPA: ATP-dependent zinc metalloprotease FtsH [Bryobacteraceae bacterium]|nr:ATP-dependent zinc metalloprotease FtsH [Bryobacteraceae bacterium]
MEKRKKRQWVFSLVYLFWALLIFWALTRATTQPGPKVVPYSQFVSEVQAGHLDEVRITNNQFIGRLKAASGQKQKTEKWIAANRLPNIDETGIIQQLESHGVKFWGHIETPSAWSELLIWFAPLLLLFGIYWYGMWKMRKGAGPLSFGRNRAKIHDQSTTFDTTFDDVAGEDEAKAELMEVIDFLKNPGKYQRLGGRIPKGVLLVGPPGTGKTMLARAVSGEARVPFFSMSGSEFVEMFVGVGAARVRDLFEQAKLKAPCIIFIDELDAIGKTRATGQAAFLSHDEREQTLNQLLAEMDGFDSSKGVIIIAATNTPEVLDPALTRAGRFDRQIVVDRPDVTGREAILKVHTRKLRLGPDVDLKVIASRTPGMVGADLANIVNEAALRAARRGGDQIDMHDFEEAIDRVTLGFEQRTRLLGPEDKQRVAWHEAGHALVALSVPHADVVHRVSIIPRSIGALGHTLQLPTDEKYLLTEPELEDRIAVLLGGRAAEELIYHGVVSTGAGDDLQKATELARQMVTRFGMSAHLGPLTYGQAITSRFLRTPFSHEERNYSEQTAEQIDHEVRDMVERLYARVKGILEERRHPLEVVVSELMKKETLERAELEALVSSAEREKEPVEKA